jgi:hypothetical protein
LAFRWHFSGKLLAGRPNRDKLRKTEMAEGKGGSPRPTIHQKQRKNPL